MRTHGVFNGPRARPDFVQLALTGLCTHRAYTARELEIQSEECESDVPGDLASGFTPGGDMGLVPPAPATNKGYDSKRLPFSTNGSFLFLTRAS